jgi:ribosomal-protein-alanine N-acetyltransferase
VNLVLAQAGLSDLQTLAILAKECGESRWTEETFYPGCRADENEIVLVLKEASSIIAYAVMAKEYDNCALYNIGVSPLKRRQGLAARLLEVGLAWGQSQSCDRCLLEVRASNAGAIRLYESLGFIHDGLRKRYYPNPDGSREDAVLMSKQLETQ